MRRFNRGMNFLLALLFTVLVACSQPVEKFEYTEPTPEVTETIDDLYLEVIREEYPELNDVPDVTLVTVAESTCLLLDSGGTLNDVFRTGQDSGLDPEMNGFITGAAIFAYCPQHKELL